MAGTASGGARRSRLAPYLLAAPGVLWLLVFFVAPVITLALIARLRSRSEEAFADRLLAAMRNQFGGHAMRKAK